MYNHDAPLPVLPIYNNHYHHCTLSAFTPTTAAAIVQLVNKCPAQSCALDPWPTTLLKTNINIIASVLRISSICHYNLQLYQLKNEACAGHSLAQEDRSGRKWHQELPPYIKSQLCLNIVRETFRGWRSTLHWRKQTPWSVPEHLSTETALVFTMTSCRCDGPERRRLAVHGKG